ncbi:MAG TPA: hypothetical protein DCS63_10835 [Elusimicrobia bacterium]|nr:hypothetical protein [Elusimicrobiota bacterium]
MKAFSKLFLTAAFLLPALRVSAGQAGADYPVIDESSVMITPAAPAARPSEPGDNPLDPVKKIVNLAMKIYKVIEENRPVVNIATDYANAVPEDVAHWTQLTGWRGPDSRVYTFSAKNPAGMEIVKASYKVHYAWGAGFKGRGQYLTGVTIEPASVVTAWGCRLDVTADVPDTSVTNAGTGADPVASLDLRLKWRLKTFTQNIEEEAVYRVRGDGELQELGTLFARGREAARLETARRSISDSRFY